MLHNISLIQVAEPISTWKVYFRSPPQPPVFRIALKAERTFFAARFFFFFLEAVGAKWGRQQRERTLESKRKRLDGKNKLVKENAAASLK